MQPRQSKLLLKTNRKLSAAFGFRQISPHNYFNPGFTETKGFLSVKTYILLAILAFATSLSAVENPKPNIILILSDDQAWGDYGFMGHDVIQTPHLDKLANRSLVFDRGYVASPLCRPSLASMLTGIYPFQHGITGNDVKGGSNRAALDLPIREKFHQFPSFVRELTSNGYLAHQSGKWWEGSYQDGGFTDCLSCGPGMKVTSRSSW